MINKSILKKLGGNYNFFEEKKKWREFCVKEANIPIYFKDWFWDATCKDEDDWWVILAYDRQGNIDAAFPFVYVKRKGLYIIESPWQVSAAGIWINNRSTDKKIEFSRLKKTTDSIVDILPYYDKFSIVFDGTFWSWQPFYWKGFVASPYYTMCIKPDNIQSIKAGLERDRRKRVNRGERKYEIRINDIDFDEYWEFLVSSFQRKNKNLEYDKVSFFKLLKALKIHNSMQMRSIYFDGEVIAVNIMLLDKNRLYHQFGTQLYDEHKDATSFGIYDAICFAARSNRVFDFEGSMIQGVCEFNSSFNPEWETHYKIESFSNRYIALNCIRKLLNVVKKVHN